MFVGIGLLKIVIHQSSSLKEKRQVVKSILGKVRSKFNVSIAEVEDNDKWQKCSLGIAVVSNDSGHAHKMLETIAEYTENLYLAEVVSFSIEIMPFGEFY
ncbi:MAG: DUF503 domain-containing protein [Deltaproteobacteria bacterium]|nr:DUF503 domain-containing protein [Deltaproteobacteria bacterium]